MGKADGRVAGKRDKGAQAGSGKLWYEMQYLQIGEHQYRCSNGEKSDVKSRLGVSASRSWLRRGSLHLIQHVRASSMALATDYVTFSICDLLYDVACSNVY
jgi:hypothetical protein